MLSPDDRQTLLDALRPPFGFHLGCAVGTTFSLGLDAALTAPAAFALYAATDAAEQRDVEPLELLDSIRRHAGRYTVFFQAGQVAVPAQRRLFAYLEGALVPVTAPGGGVFHPKVWVLRYEADGQAPTYRMLCASRNLTHDRAWDTIVRFDAADASNEARHEIDGSGLATFVRALPTLAVGEVDEERRESIIELADEVSQVRWVPPPHVHRGRFHPLGLNGSGSVPFPPMADGFAVMAPFLTAGLLKRLPPAVGRRVLISRPDQIAACAPTIAARFGEIYTLDPDATPATDHEPTSGSRTESSSARSHISPEDPSIPFDGLHAKLFVFDDGRASTVLTGSANATTAAFGPNVEFVAELVGPKGQLGVDALMAEPAKEAQTLRAFLTPFPLGDAAQYEEERDPIEDQLDLLRRQVARIPLIARAVDDGSASDRFQLSFTSDGEMDPLPSDVEWRCWPITLADASGSVVEGAVDASFSVSFEGITAFLANELTLGDTSTRFVLTADLQEAPENRATRLLRILLGDAERFLRYLLLLLTDEVVDQYGLADLLDALDSEAGQWQTAQDSLPLLEALLRTLARDPDRLGHIDRLITDLRTDPDGESLLPDGLLDIWEPIWAAAKERRP
ncbi:hypothetical protein HC251_12995 [Iamia sp. SCSIO 61187]|uniref:phospholipase D family protein n=1 Tax=Iamia sp. SCSIO 61187 TaxID=2722752 RepID=UPI001C62AB20|nr:phospholipase D family protein [Iamia sp. SCSIO 61187]QYG93251.1 hypothetical protein HC251_12995 [Iamia sp. SCSIO 61187]